MQIKRIGSLRRVLQKGLGRKPTLKVVLLFTLGRLGSKRAIKIRTQGQRTKWGHQGQMHFTHITHYSVSNAGDNILSECIRKLFELFFGPIKWNLVSMFEPVTDDYLYRLNASDAVIVGGHGAFMPDTNSNDISGWEWACSANDYTKIKKPLVIFAIGYNYFKGQERRVLFEENIGALRQRADFFGLRNKGSIETIKSFADGFSKKEIEYQPCATMVARYLYPELPPKKVTKKIAFNVALDRAEMRMGGNEELILSQIAYSMKLLQKRGYEIHFITHCDWEIRFIKYLDREKIPYKYHHATMWTTEEILSFYNEMDFVAGMRGHGIWIPFGVNCHILSLGNQMKTKWFLNDIMASDWSIDITNNPDSLADAIVDKFVKIHEVEGTETTRRLLEAQDLLWKITCTNMERIKEIIKV